MFMKMSLAFLFLQLNKYLHQCSSCPGTERGEVGTTGARRRRRTKSAVRPGNFYDLMLRIGGDDCMVICAVRQVNFQDLSFWEEVVMIKHFGDDGLVI